MLEGPIPPSLCRAVWPMGLWLAWAGASWATPPVGAEFEISSYTTLDQNRPSVGFSASGSFVVVWDSRTSSGSDTDATSIQARRFDPDGLAIGAEFQVNEFTSGEQQRGVVSVADDGDFVVAWDLDFRVPIPDDPPDIYRAIYLKRYASNGAVLDGEFLVSADTTDNLDAEPDVAIGSDGQAFVIWNSGGDLTARVIAPGRGDPPEAFQVNTYTTGYAESPEVALGPSGGLAVWSSRVSQQPGGTAFGDIRARRIGAAGEVLGADFQVNTVTGQQQYRPDVAVGLSGEFVVVWQSDELDDETARDEIRAQRLRADGVRIGGEFQVNAYTTARQQSPAVAAGPFGEFTAAWVSNATHASPNSESHIRARRFAPGGSPIGTEFQVNTYTTGLSWQAAIAVDSVGRPLVAWSSRTDADDLDGDGITRYRIRGQRWTRTYLFADGFESGDFTAWAPERRP